MNIAVTTTRNQEEFLINKAHSIAEELNIKYVERGNYSINKIIEKNKINKFIFVEKDKIILKGEGSTFFWHPSTSLFKIKAIKEGLNKPMEEALNLKEGDRVLDCTLGLATDAIVIASIIGETGRVVGIEADKYIACITKHGLKDYKDVDKEVKKIMKKIDVINLSHEEYLLNQPDNSFDVIYFDPMFKNANEKSVSINSFREFACNGGLKKETIIQALRICRRHIVIKERIGSGEFERLGVQKCYGNGKFGSIAYGVIKKNNK